MAAAGSAPTGGSASSMLTNIAQQAKKQRMMYATSSVGSATAGKSSCESPSRKPTQFGAGNGGQQVARVSVTQKSPNKTG